MLERVLANVLTNILGQYLHGIDRNSVSFGAWSGLVELRGVALRAEALAVLFETLGMDLPVTVEAGFIGLLRLVVPWKSIGSTPVKIELEGVNIIARPVRDDGSDDSEIAVRERRIKRAKLNTDDAVREASWNMGSDNGEKRSTALSWFVSDQTLAKIVANIQIELRDLVLRFEDPYSNNDKPYGVAIHCKTLKAVSANEQWEQVFIDDVGSTRTRKLVIVDGFRMEWFPLRKSETPLNTSDLVEEMEETQKTEVKYETHEELQKYFSSVQESSENTSSTGAAGPVPLISPISGSLRLDLSQADENFLEKLDPDDLPEAQALVDIRFPDISLNLDDVQYASLVQTSLYFSKLSIRGYKPKTPKDRWIWAVEQLLPGFRARRAMEFALTNEGIAKRREERERYIKSRLILLKSRRTGTEEPTDAINELERLEEMLVYDRVVRYRDLTDEQCLEESKTWEKPAPAGTANNTRGTTMSSLWSMLGYQTQPAETAPEAVPDADDDSESFKDAVDEEQNVPEIDATESEEVDPSQERSSHDFKAILARIPSVQISFHLSRGSIRLIEGGYPEARTPRIDLVMQDLVVGAKRFQSDGFLMEVLLGTIEAWDVKNNVPLIYSRVPRNIPNELAEASAAKVNSCYPTDVASALHAIRSGFETNSLPLADDELGEGEGAVDAETSSYTPSEDLMMEAKIDGLYIPTTNSTRVTQDSSTWTTNSASVGPQTTPYRVTNAEFFGKGRDEQVSSLPYISAVQIYKRPGDKSGKTSTKKRTQVVAAVGQLEAVVDGPKGSFLWALKFWKPKGLKKDPIIAFLGAAAGARIAELRMELEEAVLADKLPLLVDALIRAPRFIVPGKSSERPAIVVNMGTLGIRTSDKESRPKAVRSLSNKKELGNYSNYALSLDDLGMYIAPCEEVATSSTRKHLTDSEMGAAPEDSESSTDVKAVERLIKPLSMRFLVQVLRDATSVHAASQSEERSSSSRISRLRLRGQVPGLWLVLSQKACKHLISTAKRWSSEALIPSKSLERAKESSEDLETPLVALESKDATANASHTVTKLASYDCRVAVEHVSLELQNEGGHRLVTAVASGMSAAVVKTKHLCLESEFTLKSWTVTDGSRGSTAPFRRLVYAGIGSGVRGVSPPRSSSSSRRSHSASLSDANETNFVSIKHRFNFSDREQTASIHFLSLNLIFVRESVLKIVSFFEGLRGSKPLFTRTPQPESKESTNNTDVIDVTSQVEKEDVSSQKTRSRISLTADFDGFRIEFVSAEGSVSSVEMRDFSMTSCKDISGDIKASGDVRYFAVDDLTASIREHQSLVRYEKSTEHLPSPGNKAGSESHPSTIPADGWKLEFPRDFSGDVVFRTRLRGLQIRYLARFISVMNLYFSALKQALQTSNLLHPSEASALIEQSQEKTTELLASKTRSYLFEIDATDVRTTLPRHSANPHEAIIFDVSSVHIDNSSLPPDGYKSRVKVQFSDMRASAQYRIERNNEESFEYESVFLGQHNAELELDLADLTAQRNPSVDSGTIHRAAAPFVQARLTIEDKVSIQLCEAQYSILYFVLTENLMERVEEGSLALESGEWLRSAKSEKTSLKSYDAVANIDPSTISDDNNKRLKPALVRFDFYIPYSVAVLSRGWNVSDSSCRIVELRNRNVSGNIVYGQTELVVEVASSVETLVDLRDEEMIGTRTFTLPLANSDGSDNREEHRNFSLAYSKVFGQRPSIEINLSDLQMKVMPELLRDMTYLSIPGWPFLSTSDFAPPCAYLGRTMSISVSNSQVLLYADEFDNDTRGLVLSGYFVAKLEWIRGTGARIMSLNSDGLEIALENHLQEMVFDSQSPSDANIANRYSDRDSLILYPSDSRIEYLGPNVDENGIRASVEASSILCRINVKDTPSIFAILRRLKRLKQSYLSRRAWKHPTLEDQYRKLSDRTNSAQLQPPQNWADKAVSVSYSSPTARFLFTDESEGRFIPILELNLERVRFEGTIPSLAHIEMEMSVNLFSRKKGWWEPGLEPWLVEASLSRGASGTQAFVIKSEGNLNINVTPDTIKGANEVSSSLRSIKDKADSFLASQKKSGAERVSKPKPKIQSAKDREKGMFGPSVAAFHVFNELGLPVEIFIPVSMQRSTLLHGNELEVDMPVERLLPSYRSNMTNENISRHDTLRCQVSISGYSPLDLSAAEVGCHSVTFHPAPDEESANNKEKSTHQLSPIFVVWEIAMVQGVPLCTIRSPIQIVNRTNRSLQLNLRRSYSSESDRALPLFSFSQLYLGADDDLERIIEPDTHYSIPLVAIDHMIRIRPAPKPILISRSASFDIDVGTSDFEWSEPFNGWEWLKKANSVQPAKQKASKSVAAKNSRTTEYIIKHEIVRCRSLNSVGNDFFLAVVPESHSQGLLAHGCRLDIALQAPLSFTNKLPGRISYRISEAPSADRLWDWDDSNCTILGSDVVMPLQSAYIYCTDDTQNLSGMSIAFENAPIDIPGRGLQSIIEGHSEVPTRFGPFVSLSSVLSGQTKMLPTCEPDLSRIGKSEMGTFIHVASVNSRVPSFDLYSPFWLRNRSDVDVDVASHGSFYGKGSSPVRALGHPKGQPAGRFLCFDGPYLGVRSIDGPASSSSSINSRTNPWWVCPTDLRDVNGPVPISLLNKSLLLDVRPTRGFSNSTFTVTIRNAAFIINNTDRYLQWCQTDHLDSQGNCPFRYVQLLKPQEEAAIHWSTPKSSKSVSIRLADGDGQSDWLWSPGLPLLLGNAGEVSAKIYRPKTQVQYISRIQSSELDGGAVALMILAEDRQNPPYRIVNMCRTRSVAFRQLGTQERPWLVRPGRSTRYSWDDPITPGSKRKLQIDLIDSNDRFGASSSTHFGAPASSIATSSKSALQQNLEVNIDIVNKEFRSIGHVGLGLSYSVSMESATKLICFRDTDDDSELKLPPASSPKSHSSDPEVPEEPEVPVLLWDDFKEDTTPVPTHEKGETDESEGSRELVPPSSDYPLKEKTGSSAARIGSMSMDMDAQFYIASMGVSLVTSDPVELMYIHANGVNINYEAYDSLQCVYFQVSGFQVDNQLDNPPFPVALWANTPAVSVRSADLAEETRTVAIEVKRVVSDSGILMLKSLKAAIQPLNLRVDEEFVSRFLLFMTDLSSVSHSSRTETLEGEDGEHLTILTHLESKGEGFPRKRASTFKRMKKSFKSARRIYVEDLKLYDTQIVLSSSIARGPYSRKLVQHAALRPLMVFLMNVENCEFSFSALELKHLFSSRNHFFSLIRQFYETQVSAQKMKLLTSNSLVGNPSALFDSVALGARDFFAEPGKGEGSGDFLVGFGRGSKSLITHTVGGIVGSISSIPKAVSSGLESAVGDDAYLAERERIRGSQLSGGRRIASSNPAQGVVTGALSFAHGISSGVTGLLKDPVKGAIQGGATGFLKGVRKGLVGGVVKPVAGAIDLFAEPAAVLSKSINDIDKQRLREVTSKRPPRTFWGESKRLVAFDIRSATGEALYKGVQANSGTSFPHELVDWVELSNREGRNEPNSAEWVWTIVRERARAMNRPRRGTKSERAAITNSAQDVALQLRPEKTRVALLTFENILIVSLDCKLLLNIPLWREATFSVDGYGKDLVVITLMDKESKPESGSSIITETQNLFAAPWDAASASRRRKPNPGELVRDIISCGSVSAREDLCHAILQLLDAKQKNDLRNYAWGAALRRTPSAIELPVLQPDDEGGESKELSQTRRSDASDGSAGVFIMPMRSPVEPYDASSSQSRMSQTRRPEESNESPQHLPYSRQEVRGSSSRRKRWGWGSSSRFDYSSRR